MKLVFGKGKVSREEIEQQAASEIDALISSSDGPPPIDWSVYGLSAEVADPAVASAGLAEGADRSALDDVNGDRGAPPPEPVAPRRRSTPTTRAKAPRSAASRSTTTATKTKLKSQATAKPRARAPKKRAT